MKDKEEQTTTIDETADHHAADDWGEEAPGPEFCLPSSNELAMEKRATKEIARRESGGLIDKLSTMEDAAIIFERRAELLSACRTVAIRETYPEDWILTQDRNTGRVTAMPSKNACDIIGDVYGIELENIRPMEGGVFRPLTETDEGERITMTGWADAYSKATGRRVPDLQASRRSDEDFVGRSHPRAAPSGVPMRTDQQSAVLTLLRSKAARVIAGCSRVPLEVLQMAWESVGKSTDNCVKGHGMGGSSNERRADESSDPKLVECRKKIGQDILSLCGGDKEAAADLLEKLTTFKGRDDKQVRGIRTISRITTMNRVKVLEDKIAALDNERDGGGRQSS